MNERIRELAEQVELIQWDKLPSGAITPDYESVVKAKRFAELIVQECVGIADDYVKDCTCEEHINCKHPRSAIGRKIREHFGVEE